MSKVLLIDADSKIPNLALMKISAYHKSIGDEVGFHVDEPDKVYCSIIFDKNHHVGDGLKLFYPDAEIDVGGSGFSLTKTLPQEIESLSPDYSLYPECESYYGFTTRGCIRACHFCIVNRKEGKFRRLYSSPKEAMDAIMGGGQFNKVTFLDNNILADKQWFLDLCDYLHTNYPGMKVDFNQGLDIRLLDDDIAIALSKLRPINDWKFAFDMMSYKESVLRGIEILNKYMDVRHKCIFYIYLDKDEDLNDAITRARILKEHGATAYAMLNLNTEHTKRMKDFKRWTRPWLFWKIDFEEYVH